MIVWAFMIHGWRREDGWFTSAPADRLSQAMYTNACGCGCGWTGVWCVGWVVGRVCVCVYTMLRSFCFLEKKGAEFFKSWLDFGGLLLPGLGFFWAYLGQAQKNPAQKNPKPGSSIRSFLGLRVTGYLLLCTLLTALLTNFTDKFAGATGGLHNGSRLMKPPT